MTQQTKEVYKAIATVTRALGREGIAKTSKNVQQGYAFRGIDAIYNALSSELASANLCIIPRIVSRESIERQTRSGGALFYVTIAAEYDIVSAVDGSMHTASAYGEAMDSGDKATNKAMSAAYKYMAMQLFCIPTEGDNDADSSTHEVRSAGVSYTPPAIAASVLAHPVRQTQPDPDLTIAVKKLRKCERATSGEPPVFTQDQAKDSAVLAAEYAASRGRLYTWLVEKGVGNGNGVTLPDLSELDDQSLIDLATATARL